jgi:hypothetical protein
LFSFILAATTLTELDQEIQTVQRALQRCQKRLSEAEDHTPIPGVEFTPADRQTIDEGNLKQVETSSKKLEMLQSQREARLHRVLSDPNKYPEKFRSIPDKERERHVFNNPDTYHQALLMIGEKELHRPTTPSKR